jgi:hypothetical protein
VTQEELEDTEPEPTPTPDDVEDGNVEDDGTTPAEGDDQ